MTLFEHLSLFKRPTSEKDLTKAFQELAPHFIYGGYIAVDDAYQIYIRTVEFYFHDESDAKNAIKDPIVYHRNNRIKGLNPPYFPLMSLHTHQSGIDITFENEEQQYRASALIREFSVFDRKTHQFLKFNGKERDDRSTFLYDFLNGFSLHEVSTIVWVDNPHTPQRELKSGTRKNVFVYKEGIKTKEHDKRMWCFKLNEDIWLPTI